MKTDTKLKDALLAQLKFWVGRSADNIEVTLEDGVVTLRGILSSYEQKIYCAETVQRVAGVKEVVNDLVVELPETRRRTDAEITAAAANAIGWTTTVPPNSIKMNAKAGNLVLEGMVENSSQRGAVEFAVRHLPGITSITNLINVKPQQSQPDAKVAISSTFERHELVGAGK